MNKIHIKMNLLIVTGFLVCNYDIVEQITFY